MSFDYSGLLETSIELIDEFGKSAVIRQTATSSAAAIDYPVKVIELSKRQDGSLIPAGKTGYLVSPSGAPAIKTSTHKFYLGLSIPSTAVPLSISEVARIAPGDTVVGYEVIVSG